MTQAGGTISADFQRLDQAEDRVLELVAAGAPLAVTLDELARRFEGQAEGMLASVLLITPTGLVQHVAAPSLPAEYVRAIDGQPIGPNRGSCGTAAFTKEAVVVTDIATDPRWEAYRALALSFGLRSCWSTPIQNPRGDVLGTFAFYYSEPREPTQWLLALARRASRLATVAIQRDLHQKTLERTEQRARLTLEHALDAVIQMDAGGVVTAWNPRAEAIFGYSAREAVGRKLSALIIPDELRAAHEHGIARFLETRESSLLNRRLEVTAEHASGRRFPVELAVTCVEAPVVGDIVFSAFARDLSEQKAAARALSESQQHLSLVYDHSADVLFQVSVDPDGYRFAAVNPAFTRATGLPEAAVKGKLLREVIPEPSLSAVLAHYDDAVRTRATVRWQELTPYPTGLRRGDVSITPVLDDDGTCRHLIGAVRDMTEQHTMAAELVGLREREQLHAVLDLSPSAVAIVRDGHVRYANPRFKELFAADLGDDAVARFADRGLATRCLEEAQNGTDRFNVALVAQSAAGDELDLLATFRSLGYETRAGALAHFVDVSELKRAERSLEQVSSRLQMATRGANIGIWAWNLETGCIEWDEIMHRLYDIEPAPELDYFALWQARVHPDDRARVGKLLTDAKRSQAAVEAEFRICLAGGAMRYAKANAVIERDTAGKAVRLVGTNWDITATKHAEDSLRRAKELAEAAARSKAQFLANMSHEIRTPMNAILGYAQLLYRDRSLTDAQRRHVETVHSSGQHLLALINDILEMSKLEAGRTTLLCQPFDLRALLAEVERMFSGLTSDKKVELVFTVMPNVPSLVRGDGVKVKQVVINLLSNATKFTERGRVELRASAVALDESKYRLEIAVADTGPGIASAELGRIFNPFDQSEAGLKTGGTGLGLSISSHFARLMGGEIKVESELGRGSTFTFAFSAEGAEDDDRESLHEPIAVGIELNGSVPRVLIVDDVSTNRELLVELLSKLGFETRLAASGPEALDLHDRFRPNLVLMDLRMPEMNGFEAIAALRGKGSPARIIAITASALADAEDEARRAGADAFLRKPYREPELLHVIGRLLDVRYVYPSDTAGRHVSSATREAEAHGLSALLRALPLELRAELERAASEARAEKLQALAELARAHSERAAAEISDHAERFDYAPLLDAIAELDA